jgi:hypothetical protein
MVQSQQRAATLQKKKKKELLTKSLSLNGTSAALPSWFTKWTLVILF